MKQPFFKLVLFSGIFIAVATAQPSHAQVLSAESVGPLSVNKVGFYFETHIDVQVKGRVAKAEEPAIIGASASFTQSLTYLAKSAREVQKTFDSSASLQKWIETELCPEAHDVELRPIKQNGVRGEQAFRARVKPYVIHAEFKELSKPERDRKESVICKRSPQGSP